MLSARFGFCILPRAEFMALEKVEAFNDDKSDRLAMLELKDRAAQFKGSYVLYDPEDDGEGFLLVGNDPAELDRKCYEIEMEKRGLDA